MITFMLTRNPRAKYHLHGFKAGMEFDYSNKIIGYALDERLVMGMNTKIHQPIMDGEKTFPHLLMPIAGKPARSGYASRLKREEYSKPRVDLAAISPRVFFDRS